MQCVVDEQNQNKPLYRRERDILSTKFVIVESKKLFYEHLCSGIYLLLLPYESKLFCWLYNCPYKTATVFHKAVYFTTAITMKTRLLCLPSTIPCALNVLVVIV